MVSWTTDLGTESGSAECTAEGFWDQVAATFNIERLVEDSGEVEWDGDGGVGRTYIFQRAVLVPGMCHIVDNLSHDVHTAAMASWPRFKTHLDALMQLLCSPQHKERFVQTCARAWLSRVRPMLRPRVHCTR